MIEILTSINENHLLNLYAGQIISDVALSGLKVYNYSAVTFAHVIYDVVDMFNVAFADTPSTHIKSEKKLFNSHSFLTLEKKIQTLVR